MERIVAVKQPVDVDIEKCNQLSRIIQAKHIPIDEEDSKLIGFSQNK